jgi:hypothetical protein
MDSDGFDTLRYAGMPEFRIPVGLENYRARLHEAFPSEHTAVERICRLLAETAEAQALGVNDKCVAAVVAGSWLRVVKA